MAVLTIEVAEDVKALIERQAADRRQTIEAYVAVVVEEAVVAERRRDRERLLDLLDQAGGEVGPISWTREDVHGR